MLFPVVVSPDYVGAGEGEGLGMFGWLVGKSSLRGQPRSPSLSFPGVFSVSQSPSPIRCRFPASLGAVVLMVEVTITSCSS